MRAILVGLFGLWSGAAMAADVALIVGNQDYRRLPDVRSADDVISPGNALSRRGFDVVSVRDGDAASLGSALAQFAEAAEDADHVVVVLAGHFRASATDAWLVPTDAPERVTLPQVSRTGISLSVINAILAEHPGRAVLVLGDAGTSGAAGAYLEEGFGTVDPAQGVTLFTGEASSVSWFVSTALFRPGIRLSEAAGRVSGVTTNGYLPDDYVFLSQPQSGPSPDPRPVPLPDPDPATEATFWDATRKADTVAAYEAYLRRYPEGPHAAEARRQIQDIKGDPNRPARLAEDALKLTRDQRREIQRALSLLGHDTRGIDGIFGPGTRSAIASFQTASGYVSNGYLTRDQISDLAQQADVRAAQLEREAEARRLEQERQDRAYWQATGAVGDEAGLRAYLARYPDGTFAELAHSRLDAIEEANRAKAAAQDRAAWDRAVAANTVVGYRLYLREFPRGAFADEAKARIDEMTRDEEQSEANREAEAREAALNLNGATRLLIERRLDALDLRPGEVDGEFDARTRRAIRRYQQQRDIPPTGYLDQGTVVRIMADVILR